MRSTFYRLYLIELERDDGGDRLRKFLLRFPDLAKMTYQFNLRDVESQRLKGKKLTNWEKFLLIMNSYIKISLNLKDIKDDKRDRKKRTSDYAKGS